MPHFPTCGTPRADSGLHHSPLQVTYAPAESMGKRNCNRNKLGMNLLQNSDDRVEEEEGKGTKPMPVAPYTGREGQRDI